MEQTESKPENNSQINARWNGVRFRRILNHVATALDDRPWILISILFVLYLHLVLHERANPLWYDELFTYYIAQAPTFSKMITWTRHIDLNPPLSYAAARLSIYIFHPSQIAVRLPSIIGYFAAVLCIYRFVRRRLTPLYGSIASLILLGSSFSYYSQDARPYALVLGFLGIASLGWQAATEDGHPRRALSLLLVLIGGFGMLLSHVLAVVAYGALFMAEFTRLGIRRKTDWPLWICLIFPLSSCVLYLPMIQNHGGGVYAPIFQASIQALFDNYSSLWMDLAGFLAAALLLIALVGIKSPEKTHNKFCPNLPETAFCIFLLLIPLIVVLRFMQSHSMYNVRYGMPAIFGAAILVPYFIAWWTDTSRRAALIGAAVFIFSVLHPSSLARILQAHLEPSRGSLALRRELKKPLSQIQPNLPFVAADGLTFLEMDHRESASFLSRVYYLIDPQAALEYAHSNVFNGLQSLPKEFPIRAHIGSYDQFIKLHPSFIVFGSCDYPDDWLMQKLLADGAIVRYLGEVPSTYKDSKVYEVSINSQSPQ